MLYNIIFIVYWFRIMTEYTVIDGTYKKKEMKDHCG